jgi:hypothetical protein
MDGTKLNAILKGDQRFWKVIIKSKLAKIKGKSHNTSSGNEELSISNVYHSGILIFKC